jgi:hypothetical protein
MPLKDRFAQVRNTPIFIVENRGEGYLDFLVEKQNKT